MKAAAEGRQEAKGDIVVGIVLLVICAVGTWSLISNRIISDFDYGSDPGPGLVPALLLSVLALCAVTMVGSSTIKLYQFGKSDSTVKGKGTGWRSLLLPALFIISLLVYSQTMESVGFIVTTVSFATIWCVLIGLQDEGKPVWSKYLLYVIEGVLIMAVVYTLFAKLIQVPLP